MPLNRIINIFLSLTPLFIHFLDHAISKCSCSNKKMIDMLSTYSLVLTHTDFFTEE